MIADLSQLGGGGDDNVDRRQREIKTAIATAAAQLRAALLEHKQIQLRMDNSRLAIEEAMENLRRAAR